MRAATSGGPRGRPQLLHATSSRPSRAAARAVAAPLPAAPAPSPTMNRLLPLTAFALLSSPIQAQDSAQLTHVAYRAQIQDYALAIGRKLRDRGVVSRFAVDFVVARGGSKPWRALAIEINLRMGGTTVPFLALQFLTAGSLDPNSGEFLTPSGERRFYRATDGLASPAYRGLLPEDLIELLHRSDLGYSPDRRTGVLFHMLGALSEHGKVGVTAIGNSSEDAESLFRGVVEMLDHETSGANSSVATQRREKTLRLSME